MPHLDSEHLLLLALGERMLEATDLGHLGACASCQAEYDGLTAVASIARASREVSSCPRRRPRSGSGSPPRPGYGSVARA